VAANKKQERRRLIRDLVLVVGATVAAAILVSLLVGDAQIRDLSGTLMSQSARMAEKEIRLFFEPVERMLLSARDWGRNGALSLDDERLLAGKFIPLLKQLPQVSSVSIVDSVSGDFYLLRDSAGWLTFSSTERNGLFLRRLRVADTVAREGVDSLDYIPRERPWYIGALQAASTDSTFWTTIRPLYKLNQPGITASAVYRAPDTALGVIAFDILLSDMLTFIDTLTVGENGLAFIIDTDGRLITGYGIDSLGEGLDTVITTDETREVLYAARRLFKTGSDQGQILTGSRVVIDGTPWWIGFHQAEFGQRGLWVGTAVPEREFLAQKNTRRWLSLALVVGLVGIGIVILIVRLRAHFRIVRQIDESHFDHAKPVESLRELLRRGESKHLEFKSTMRMNLATGKKGKEIEIAWLKTVAAFLNTDGGILLIGVDDDAKVVGLDADGFDNPDKCRLHFKNVFNQHLGAEFSDHVQLDLVQVDGKTVAVVECRPTDTPVFLTLGKDEDFYVRSGPSSLKLSTSKALDYIEQRRRQTE
jgi:hypothetical protein